MKKLWLFLIPLLVGCTTTKELVYPEFPDPPKQSVNEQCKDLLQTPITEKLSDVISIVSKNYEQYHICSAKVDAWIKWYKDQKKIYNESLQ